MAYLFPWATSWQCPTVRSGTVSWSHCFHPANLAEQVFQRFPTYVLTVHTLLMFEPPCPFGQLFLHPLWGLKVLAQLRVLLPMPRFWTQWDATKNHIKPSRQQFVGSLFCVGPQARGLWDGDLQVLTAALAVRPPNATFIPSLLLTYLKDMFLLDATFFEWSYPRDGASNPGFHIVKLIQITTWIPWMMAWF